MKPYKDNNIQSNVVIRVFDENIDPIELKWHRDDEDRLIEAVEPTNWLVQFDNELPMNMDKPIFIPKHMASYYKRYGFLKNQNNKIMNITEIRTIINQVIEEAKKDGKLPKSGGKLVHLKKELASLKKMKESLGQYNINESEEPVAEYAHLQKFVNELNKVKAASAKLSETLDAHISEVESKIKEETQKIKEMIGLAEPAKKKVKKEEGKKEEMEESFQGLVKKIEKGGKSEKYATKVAGAVAAAKMKGAGSGPTKKQKARLKEEEDPNKLKALNLTKDIIRKAPKEDQEALVSFAKIMYNWPWYWEMSDARNTEQDYERKAAVASKIAKNLQTEEGENAVMEIFNAYAPEAYKINSWDELFGFPNLKK